MGWFAHTENVFTSEEKRQMTEELLASESWSEFFKKYIWWTEWSPAALRTAICISVPRSGVPETWREVEL